MRILQWVIKFFSLIREGILDDEFDVELDIGRNGKYIIQIIEK